MTVHHRIAIALSASALIVGLGFAPAAVAMESMSKGSMHKPMKKHKSSMKGDAMKGGAMKGDAMKGDEPAQ